MITTDSQGSPDEVRTLSTASQTDSPADSSNSKPGTEVMGTLWPKVGFPSASLPSATADPPSSLQTTLLDDLASLLPRFVVLPKHAAETLALWIVHTYCFQFRDVSTYLGIESPVKRCGKTTLLSVLGKLVNRPVVASNISPSAFFRVIEEMQPTLIIDEADTFLQGNDELRGIFNAGYYRPNAYVIRVSSMQNSECRVQNASSEKVGMLSTASQTEFPQSGSPDSKTEIRRKSESQNSGTLWKASLPSASLPSTSSLATYSCWCPKVIAAIGHLPETLADRCIVIRMQRKRGDEECERLRNLEGDAGRVTGEGKHSHVLHQRCAQFALDHQDVIANARPGIPNALNDRAADIWEPLLAIADIAGGCWPEKARAAAVALTTGAQESSPSSTLLFDIGLVFVMREAERLFTYQLLEYLNSQRFAGRPWTEPLKGKPATEIWLARQLRPFGVRSKLLRMGDRVGKGYELLEMQELFKRYVPATELENWKAENVK